VKIFATEQPTPFLGMVVSCVGDTGVLLDRGRRGPSSLPLSIFRDSSSKWVERGRGSLYEHPSSATAIPTNGAGISHYSRIRRNQVRPKIGGEERSSYLTVETINERQQQQQQQPEADWGPTDRPSSTNKKVSRVRQSRW
jgi:hypothetical protein